MDQNLVTTAVNAINSPNSAISFLIAYGLKKAYDDFASPTIKKAGLLGAKIFGALTVAVENWAEAKLQKGQKLQDDIMEILKDTDQSNITTNPLGYVIVPAINQYYYSMDSEEIRHLYAQLIAKALLVNYQKQIHPTFVHIIENLHPFEALIMRDLFYRKPGGLSVINTMWKNEKGRISSLQYVYQFHKDIAIEHSGITMIKFQNLTEGQPEHLSNLNRLGLADVNFMQWYVDEKPYKSLESLDKVKVDRENCVSSHMEFEIEKGIIRLTPLGEFFCKICVAEKMS